MTKGLTRNFFIRPTLIVAKQLLGKYLIRCYGQRKIIGKIVETEAYIGPKDRASHAYLGKKTKRNLVEYLIGGHIYIYLVYGMYWQLNITTGLAGQPECVLIRALEPVLQNKKPASLSGGSKIKNKKYILKIKNLANGPGKLCRWLKLNKSFYGEDLTRSQKIWLAASIRSGRASRRRQGSLSAAPKRRENGEKNSPSQIVAVPRIGIDYAGQYWAKKKWRFHLKNNIFVSKQ